jgi:hypothetical protein
MSQMKRWLGVTSLSSATNSPPINITGQAVINGPSGLLPSNGSSSHLTPIGPATSSATLQIGHAGSSTYPPVWKNPNLTGTAPSPFPWEQQRLDSHVELPLDILNLPETVAEKLMLIGATIMYNRLDHAYRVMLAGPPAANIDVKTNASPEMWAEAIKWLLEEKAKRQAHAENLAAQVDQYKAKYLADLRNTGRSLKQGP